MKRALFIISTALLFILPSRVCSQEMVDLGLPSGTKWKQYGENGYYTYYDAKTRYSNQLPTERQIRELMKYCKWSWQDGRYKVEGPNGNYIFLEANGYKEVYDTKVYKSTDDILKSASDQRDRGVYVSEENIAEFGRQGVYAYANNSSNTPIFFMFDFYKNSFKLDYSFENKSSWRGKYSYRVSIHLVETDRKKLEEMTKEENRLLAEQKKKRRGEGYVIQFQQYQDEVKDNLHLFTQKEGRQLQSVAEFRDVEVAKEYTEKVEKIVKERQRIYDFISQHSDIFPKDYYYDILERNSKYHGDYYYMNYNSIYNSVIDEYNTRKPFYDNINQLIGDWKADKNKYSCNITLNNDQLYLTIKHKDETILEGYITSVIDKKSCNIKEINNGHGRFDDRYYEIVHSKITKDVIVLKIGWCSKDRNNHYLFYYKNGDFILDKGMDCGNGYGRTIKTVTFRK